MDFEVGSKVFYPTHGAGWIKDKKEIEFNGEKKTYFEFDFITFPASFIIPFNSSFIHLFFCRTAKIINILAHSSFLS